MSENKFLIFRKSTQWPSREHRTIFYCNICVPYVTNSCPPNYKIKEQIWKSRKKWRADPRIHFVAFFMPHSCSVNLVYFIFSDFFKQTPIALGIHLKNLFFCRKSGVVWTTKYQKGGNRKIKRNVMGSVGCWHKIMHFFVHYKSNPTHRLEIGWV